ncbi:mediator of RNA polymerase II transcription subunit 16 [Ixodes scapularis]|nr:mediator of RNA polymerase II transcription subunit 16 [Ixodes scapularis]
MDHVYSVLKRFPSSIPTSAEWLTESKTVCSVSSHNTLAFTSSSDVQEPVGKITCFHVYVVDLNMPWDAHKVMTHSEEITCIEWDVGASKLLITDAVGQIQLWSMKNYLLNDWTMIASASFPGEYVLVGAWFHNGKKIGLNMEKKDSMLYLEKYVHIRFGPSVRQVGGKPSEGCIAVTSSGLVCVVILQSDETVVTGTEILGQYRNRLKVVDLCYGKNGDFLVVTSDGLVQSSVHCYRIALKLNQDKCIVSCQPFSSFYLNCHVSPQSREKPTHTRVTHLNFVLREAADAVAVSVSGCGGSTIELWELREKPVRFHKVLHTPSSAETATKTVGWQHHASTSYSSPVMALCTPRLSIYDMSPPPSYIIAAYKDNVIKCFSREYLNYVCSINISAGSHRRDDHGIKYQHLSATVSHMQLSWTSGVLVAVDSLSQLFLFRLSPVTEPGNPISPSYTVTLLEHCLMTGTDWWDVLLGLRPDVIETVCAKMTEVFNKQPPGIQQYLLSRFLTVKGSLYRCLANGQARAGDCHAQIMLNAVSAVMKGLLRPRDLSSHEKGPAETLTAVMSGREVIANLDKVLLHLETKEFSVEPLILQSLQQLTQWVADLTLHLMASLPQQVYNHMRFPGGGLIADPKSLNMLRELLVIFRMWGFISESCLPAYTKMTDNLDILSLLFKLLTKTLLNHGSEPDETLLDECCLLPSQILIPSIDLGNHAEGVASPALFLNSLPLPFEFGIQPDFLHIPSKLHAVEGSVAMPSKVDIVRHIGLGSNPSAARHCTRCFSISMVRPGVKAGTIRAWEQRWVRFCPCGGQWRLVM